MYFFHVPFLKFTFVFLSAVFPLTQVRCTSFLFNMTGGISFKHTVGLPPSSCYLPSSAKHSYSHTVVTANSWCPLLTRTQEMHYHIRLWKSTTWQITLSANLGPDAATHCCHIKETYNYFNDPKF